MANDDAKTALMWNILQADSAGEVARLMDLWYQDVRGDPELAELPGFEGCLKAEDWQGARAIVERALGRNHPRHRKTLDVLFAAVQNKRLMLAQQRRSALDLIAGMRPMTP